MRSSVDVSGASPSLDHDLKAVAHRWHLVAGTLNDGAAGGVRRESRQAEKLRQTPLKCQVFSSFSRYRRGWRAAVPDFSVRPSRFPGRCSGTGKTGGLSHWTKRFDLKRRQARPGPDGPRWTFDGPRAPCVGLPSPGVPLATRVSRLPDASAPGLGDGRPEFRVRRL